MNACRFWNAVFCIMIINIYIQLLHWPHCFKDLIGERRKQLCRFPYVLPFYRCSRTDPALFCESNKSPANSVKCGVINHGCWFSSLTQVNFKLLLLLCAGEWVALVTGTESGGGDIWCRCRWGRADSIKSWHTFKTSFRRWMRHDCFEQDLSLLAYDYYDCKTSLLSVQCCLQIPFGRQLACAETSNFNDKLMEDKELFQSVFDLPAPKADELPRQVEAQIHLKATLIIMPKNLQKQWANQIAAWVCPSPQSLQPMLSAWRYNLPLRQECLHLGGIANCRSPFLSLENEQNHCAGTMSESADICW